MKFPETFTSLKVQTLYRLGFVVLATTFYMIGKSNVTEYFSCIIFLLMLQVINLFEEKYKTLKARLITSGSCIALLFLFEAINRGYLSPL